MFWSYDHLQVEKYKSEINMTVYIHNGLIAVFIGLKTLRKTTINFSQNSQYSGRDSNRTQARNVTHRISEKRSVD
jgi:hypothetical protein